MRSPGIVQRHPELWWLASVAVIVTVGVTVGTSVSGVFRSDSSLPATSPDALVSNVLERHPAGYSGTITGKVALGLPQTLTSSLVAAVPAVGAMLNGATHTVQYWYGGPDKQRLALRTRGGEQDVFRDGSRLVAWNTATGTAQSSALDPGASDAALTAATPLSLTPPQLAEELLEKTRDDSDTSLRSGDTVAGRPTYELVLRPRPAASRIGEVHVQVDGTQFVPLAVKIYARDAETPAVNVAFTSIRFAAPAERNFTFTPPAGAMAKATMPEVDPVTAVLGATRLRGSGWSTIATYKTSARDAALMTRYLGTELESVVGRWGKGKQACAELMCLLVTDKGAVLAGAVEPAALYAAVD